MYRITVEECFSSSQPTNTSSEIFSIQVNTPRSSLDITSLKHEIVRKGSRRFSDASCITLILPDGGDTLVDEMIPSRLEVNTSILALVSKSAVDAAHVQVHGGVHVAPVLCTYGSDHCKFHCKLPHSVKSADAGKWVSGQILWSATSSDLLEHFSHIGFDPAFIKQELGILATSRSSEVPIEAFSRSAGRIGPLLLGQIWKCTHYKGGGSGQLAPILKELNQEFEIERRQWTQKIQSLKSAQATLKDKIEYELFTLKRVSEGVQELQQAEESRELVGQLTGKLIEKIKEKLLKTISCPNCSIQYSPTNLAGFPVHLSCGHVFCKGCLQHDWIGREMDRVQPTYRCLHECADFDFRLLVEKPHYMKALMEAWQVISESGEARTS